MTITKDTLAKQVANYQAQVDAGVPGTSTYKTSLNLLNIYTKVLAGAISSIDTLNKNLATLQANLARILKDIQTYCVATTTTAAPVNNPCGEFKINNLNPGIKLKSWIKK